MTELIKDAFQGEWKSWKQFQLNGRIKLDSQDNYLQFIFSEEQILTIKRIEQGKPKVIANTSNWDVDLTNNRHFLTIKEPHLTYEVVTLNHTVLVLLEKQSSDKIFLASAPFWKDYLKSNKMMNF